MAMAETTLEFNADVFYVYATYAVIVLFKMLLMSLFTARQRISKKVRRTPEDYIGRGEKLPEKWPIYDDDVERVRRCHRNDLENIPPFLIIGALYVFTNPSLFMAAMHYRIFVLSRIFHTIAYLMPLPFPSRSAGFAIGMFTTLSMGLQILLSIGSF